MIDKTGYKNYKSSLVAQNYPLKNKMAKQIIPHCANVQRQLRMV